LIASNKDLHVSEITSKAVLPVFIQNHAILNGESAACAVHHTIFAGTDIHIY
jgi:hypothetical protein